MSQHLIGRTLAGLAVAATVVIVAGQGPDSAPPAPSTRETVTMPQWALKQCATEGAVNCRRDADMHGNKTGHSYIVRQVPGSARMVCVFYMEPAYARHHDYCTAAR